MKVAPVQLWEEEEMSRAKAIIACIIIDVVASAAFVLLFITAAALEQDKISIGAALIQLGAELGTMLALSGVREIVEMREERHEKE